MAADGTGANGGLDKKLQAEILNLIQYIQRLRSEIAGIAQGKEDQTAFDSMGDRHAERSRPRIDQAFVV